MNASARVLEPKLAYDLWQTLMKLSDLLWECYDKDFLDYDEKEQAGFDKGPDLEVPF